MTRTCGDVHCQQNHHYYHQLHHAHHHRQGQDQKLHHHHHCNAHFIIMLLEYCTIRFKETVIAEIHANHDVL